MRIPKPAALAATIALALAGTAPAAGAGPMLDLRYRYEQVEEDPFERDARAHTLRARLGWRWQPAERWSAFAEFEHVQALSDSYNSTANGRTRYPVVADPEATELNQLYVAWQGAAAGAILGRQRINLDNQRFIGAVGWRQNEQTFDALYANWQPAADWTLRYGYLAKVHRVFGDDHPNPLMAERDLDAHVLNLAYAGAGGRWIGYAYLIEDQDAAAASSATFGLRHTGEHAFGETTLAWTVELAHQSDHSNNPADYGARYWLLEPSLRWRGLVFRAGWEHLGGDGRSAVQTPLATLHAFNGWADRFLTTPPGGLEDRYLGIGGPLGPMTWSLVYHDFEADTGGDYGREWDASLAWPLPHGFAALAKLARYDARGHSTDVTKLWLQLEWKYAR
ncbi:MAG TPA: alginate export family protein [Xanthomonadaceae bacterium]|nr:alginate export family protein [Xanthomonadaceae bacterium]